MAVKTFAECTDCEGGKLCPDCNACSVCDFADGQICTSEGCPLVAAGKPTRPTASQSPADPEGEQGPTWAEYLPQLAREAIDVQNACNPLGISKGYAEAMQSLADCLRAICGGEVSTRHLCDHPIARLWAAKVADLHGVTMARYDEAYRSCRTLAKGGV